MIAHAPWSPSALPVTVHCNGHREMVEGLPETESESAREGKAAHWVAETWLGSGVQPVPGTIAPNGVFINQEMINHVARYVTDCQSIGAEMHIEEVVTCPRIHASDCWGTPDFWTIKDMVLYVFDLKYGWGLIEVWWQLMAYVCGIIDQLGIPDQRLTICLRFYQPRPWHPRGPVREWRGPAEDIRGQVNIMHNACNGPTSLNSGPHCKNCEARLFCPANRQAVMNAIDVAGWPVSTELPDPNYEFEILRRAADVINNRLAAREAEIIEKIKNGPGVNGWNLEPGRGSVVWNDPAETVISMGGLMGVDLRSNKTITPKQAESAGVPCDVVNSLSSKKPGKMKLVKTENTLAHRVFSQKCEEN